MNATLFRLLVPLAWIPNPGDVLLRRRRRRRRRQWYYYYPRSSSTLHAHLDTAEREITQWICRAAISSLLRVIIWSRGTGEGSVPPSTPCVTRAPLSP